MKRPIFATMLLLTAATANAEIPAGWSTNVTDAFVAAKSNETPVLVFFTASWCGPCKLMAHTTLTNDAVVQALAPVSHVAADIDDLPKLAEQHSVQAVPTFEVLLPDGSEAARTTGYQSPQDFLQWLTNAVSDATQAVARQHRSKAKLEEIDRQLESENRQSDTNAARALFDLLAERDESISQAAAVRVKTLARRSPRAVLEGMNDPRLATRIQVANALRERLGETFDMDPWSDAPTRAREIASWRGKIADGPTSGKNP